MIARLFGGAINLAIYLSAATMIAAAVMGCYLWNTWHMDRGRLVQMLAIAQGLDLFEAEAEAKGNAKEGGPSAEQPSMQQIIDARLAKDRDLTMREMGVQNGSSQLRQELKTLINERDAYNRLRDEFEARLAKVQEGAEAEGRTAVAATLQSIEPEQAKQFLLEMLDKQETEDVVILLTGMDERRRAGILGEFQTAEEIAKIAEVLRLIRQGHPNAAIANEVSQKVDSENLGTK